MAATTAMPFAIAAANIATCAQGRIVYAGTKWNSQATYGHAAPPDFFRPTAHYLLVYTLEGEADYRDDTGVVTVLRPGTLVFTAPGVQQSYGPCPGSRWSEFFMWFSGPLFDAWQDSGLPGARSRVLTLAPVALWMKRFAVLCRPLESGRADSPLIRLCALQAILAEAIQAAERNSQDAAAPWLDESCRLLADGTLTTPGLEQIARRLGISYSLFRSRFAALMGRTPGQYRQEEIMRRACLRMTQSAEPLGAIAEDLGFHDQFHFSRRFKAVMGLAPTQFRRQSGGAQISSGAAAPRA